MSILIKDMTRAEAIEHLKNIAIYSVQDGYTDEARQALDMAIKALEEPERLTDYEQRIFLAAMGREEKVCKKVDDDWRDRVHVDDVNLVGICHEIIRKVKGALWN